LKCPFCQKVFCKIHFPLSHIVQQDDKKPLDAGHTCTQAHLFQDKRTLVCPLCQQIIPMGSQVTNPNVAVNLHISKGCPKESSTPSSSQFHLCSLNKCGKKELVLIECEVCLKKFCIKHRLERDHQCVG
jgi:hypothetical protein